LTRLVFRPKSVLAKTTGFGWIAWAEQMENNITAARNSGHFFLSISCNIAEVRPASAALRQYLQQHGLSETELSACELAIVEALNNAIQYASPSGSSKPVILEAICSRTSVLFQITDHTCGFVLPDHIDLPSFDAERGRGLFLIKTAMAQMHYECSSDGNCLMLRMRRATR
jgi:anti-sigma regulatory factor (Ser/Thr protein kinase)